MSADPDLFSECFVFSAPDRARLLIRLAEWEKLAAAPLPGARLLDAAAAAASEFNRAGATLALAASSFEELHKKLAHARERLANPETRRIQDKSGIFYYDEKLALGARIAFVFPGEGAQYPNMLRGLCVRYPDAREPFDEFDEACADAADGYRPSAVIFPTAQGGRAEDELYDMRGAVHAVACANYAFARLFRRCGIRPDALLGHSSGEFVAMELAGVLRFAARTDRVRFIRDGFELMNALAADPALPPTALITIGGVDRAEIEALCRAEPESFRLAMDNCPHQVVLACPPARADEVIARFTESGAICARLPFDRPYHTAWFAPALTGLRQFLRRHGLHPPTTPLCSCMTADYFPTDPEAIERLAVEQWASCVRFREAILRLYADGVRVFIDAGPRGNMTAFVDDILRDAPHLTITANRAQRSDVAQFNLAIAQLAAHGAAIEPSALFAGRGARALEGSTPRPGRPLALASEPPVMRAIGFAPRISTVPGAPAPATALLSAPPPAPSSPAPLSERDAAMLAYVETMEKFLAAQREVMLGLFTTPSHSYPAEADYPLLGTIIEHEPGRRLVARRVFDLNEDLFLRDHTLGVDVSREDPDLPALSIMPLTMSLAMCAEAAQALMPELRVVALQDVQAARWISLEQDRVTVVATAERDGEAGEIRVVLREEDLSDPRAAYRPPSVQATARMAAEYPPAPPMPAIALKHERPAKWSGSEIYPDRLFHRSRLQGIRAIHRWAEEGLTGSLEVLPRDDLFASTPNPRFTVDGVLLDAVGSVLGLWGNYEKWSGVVYLPFRVKQIEFFGPPLPVGTRLDLAMSIRRNDPGHASCDFFVATPDGRLQIRISQWEDRAWNISRGLHRLLLRAFDMDYSEPLALPPAVATSLKRPLVLRIACDIPYDILEGSHRVWQKVLAFLALDREGRAEFKALRGTERRRSEWVAGRATLKEAVRHLLQATVGEAPPIADIPIRTDDRGRPIAMGAWQTRHPALRVHVSLAHAGATAVAAACEGASVAGIGVDVEPLRAPSPDLAAGAFAPDDRPADDETFWRRWCAKEAVGKALGTGLIYDPRDLRIAAEDPATGRVDIRLSGAWGAALPAYKEKTICAYTFRDKNEIFAVCVL